MGLYRISSLFFACFILSCMIFSVIPPSGASGAGLTYGFVHAMSSPFYALSVMLVLISFAWLRTISWSVLPMTFLLIFLCSGLMHAHVSSAYPFAHYLVLGLALLVILLLCFIDSYVLLITAVITCSFAYHLGFHGLNGKPPAADGTYFIFGQAIAMGLILGSTGCMMLLFFSKDVFSKDDVESL